MVRPLEFILRSGKILGLFLGQGTTNLAGAEEIAFRIFRSRPNFYHQGEITIDKVNDFLNRDDSPFEEFKSKFLGEQLSLIRSAKEAAENWRYENLLPGHPIIEEPGLYTVIWVGNYKTHCHECGKEISPGTRLILNLERIYPTKGHHFCSHECHEKAAGGHEKIFAQFLRLTMEAAIHEES